MTKALSWTTFLFQKDRTAAARYSSFCGGGALPSQHISGTGNCALLFAQKANDGSLMLCFHLIQSILIFRLLLYTYMKAVLITAIRLALCVKWAQYQCPADWLHGAETVQHGGCPPVTVIPQDHYRPHQTPSASLCRHFPFCRKMKYQEGP